MIIPVLCLLCALPMHGAPKARDFSAACDSLSARLKRRSGVDMALKMVKVTPRGNELDLYFSSELSYYPWHDEDIAWFRRQLDELWIREAQGYRPGRIFSNRYELPELSLPSIGADGVPSEYKRSIPDPRKGASPFIEKCGARKYPLGLDGRYIALWQSHGRYYDETQGCWLWQRACLHRTVEDMFTQSFVLPFLMPMLENSGAYVMTPRERDLQWREIITDNDPSFDGPRDGSVRKAGRYTEKGSWSNAGEGFADFRRTYTFSDNPFKAGTARSTECTGDRQSASATWTPDIEQRGAYAVYISYKTLPNSTEYAHYTVRHLGGTTEFTVNQKRGGGTWIYLGTFEFGEGTEGFVRVDSRGPAGSVVTADAVKIGGGMGKLERGGSTSGMPAYAEGAHYWMQWAGTDSSITRAWDTDYTNDFASRGSWTVMMKEQKDIPIDMSLAFHTDAGVTPSDSTIGTLAIYTLRCDGEREFSDGRDRIISRLLCDYVQSQVVDDIRTGFDPLWSRRGLWDKSYSECRTSGVPAMILELLSHQNFADMKYGLDPSFQFTVCRAVYKGILKTLSEYYGCNYAVQPLPVKEFSARLNDDGKVHLSWKATEDPKEPTAVSEGYIVYTRVDGMAFDDGMETTSDHIDIPIEKGHIYSFKVEAYNKGGRSFPSQILSAGIPEKPRSNVPVLIVNNFDRVSAPAWTDAGEHAGFESRKDCGVPYIRDICYIGENYEFNREATFIDNDYPGFGASFDDCAGSTVAGNSFDYPYVHGKSIFALGYPFCSMSREAFCNDGWQGGVVDLICGKQRKTQIGRGAMPERFEVFPAELRTALGTFTAKGGHVLISGSSIASDCNDKEADFTASVLGYRLATPYGTHTGMIGDMAFSDKMNPDIYCVECPDGLKPYGKNSGVWLRYPGSPFGAAVYSNHSGKYRTVAIGVPIETLKEESDREFIFRAALEYFDGRSKPMDHSQVK